MSDKQTVLEIVGRMPDTASIEQIRNQLLLCQSLREGLADSQAGRVIPHEEIKKQFAAWTSH
jgi:predicted transcriptional regulator